jgi:hypothetical protein
VFHTFDDRRREKFATNSKNSEKTHQTWIILLPVFAFFLSTYIPVQCQFSCVWIKFNVVGAIGVKFTSI